MYAFEVENLVKNFGSVKALDGVSLKAKQGEIFGLLGPNGAGKTTLVRLLSTLITPTSGDAKVLGMNVVREAEKVRRSIGLAGQFAAVDEFLTGYENLYMVGRLYQLDNATAKKRANDILESLSLTDAANRQAKTYSGGMRRRLDLGACLVGRPKVLFLDEPTTGLDPRTRLELWALIEDLVAGGTSIILTTQYLEEADRLAKQIAVIDKGKVIAEGTSAQLKSRLGGEVVEFEVATKKELEKATKAVAGLTKKAPKILDNGQGLSVSSSDGAQTLMRVVEALNKERIVPTTISLHEPSLDDVFLALTGKPTHEEATK
jgi:ABC-2 type transport system ATP-binding protein